MARIFKTPAEMLTCIGEELGPTDWLLIDQARVDLFAEATGDHQWIHVDPERAKDVMADILAGGKPCLAIEAGDPGWLESLPLDHSGDWMIRISDRNITPNPNELLIYPPTLVVGVGCERDCDPNELRDLVYQTLSDAGLAPQSVTAIVSIDVKADEPALHVTADSFGVPARFFSAAQLEAETPRTENPSDIVFREVGTHGVSESAALAAVGPRRPPCFRPCS